jgi:hypothetical protein
MKTDVPVRDYPLSVIYVKSEGISNIDAKPRFSTEPDSA